MRVIFIITGLSSGQEDGEGGDNEEHKGDVDADVDTKLALLMESKIGQTLETLASSLPNIQVSLARAILRGGVCWLGLPTGGEQRSRGVFWIAVGGSRPAMVSSTLELATP